jgi:hypothetical protein
VRLPAAGLIVSNGETQLQDMVGAMLVLIPSHCHCAAVVSRLAQISGYEGTVLVGTKRTFTEAQDIQSRLNSRVAANVTVALDEQHVLSKVVPVQGLTAVVISGVTTKSGESVEYASQLTARDLSANGGSLSAALTRAIRG